MSDGYIFERLSRTSNELELGSGDLRERLPSSYENGLSTIADVEISDLGSQDLLMKFRKIKAAFMEIRPEGQSWATASVAAMDDKKVTKLAIHVVDFIAKTKNLIENQRKEVGT